MPWLSAGMREHPPVATSDLLDHIERLKANDGLGFSLEYEVTYWLTRKSMQLLIYELCFVIFNYNF